MAGDINMTTGGRVLLDIIQKSEDPEGLVNYLLCAASDLQSTNGQSQSA